MVLADLVEDASNPGGPIQTRGLGPQEGHYPKQWRRRIYYLVAEAITNVAKYAQATRAIVDVELLRTGVYAGSTEGVVVLLRVR
jgi:signal transduction histidine kinase